MIAKLHTTLRRHGVGVPAQGHHHPPQPPPAPVAVHHHPQLEHQVEDHQGEDEADDVLLGLLQHADSSKATKILYDSKKKQDQQKLEAEYRDPPPVEGEVEVEAGVVVVDGGHHRDLEEEECGEESDDEAPSDQEADVGRVDVPEGFQQQEPHKQRDHSQLVADGEVGVENIEEPVLVCLVLPHVEEVDGESEQVTHQEDESGNNYDNFSYLVEKIF